MDDVPNEETVNETTKNEEIDEKEKLRQQQTIKIENVRHPGGWLSNQQIQRLLNRSQNFCTKFEREENTSEKQIKLGRIEIEFSTVEAAREAYTTLQKVLLDGAKLTISVAPVFFEAVSTTSSNAYFTASDDENTKKCTIYALYLPRSADKKLLECIVGSDVIKSFKMLSMPGTEVLMQAEIIVNDEETATTLPADEDDFPIDDGEINTVVKLLTPGDYFSFVESETRAKPFVVPSSGKENQLPSSEIVEDGELKGLPEDLKPEEVLAPEIEENDVLEKMIQLIETARINFAEINEKHELYTICDQVSGSFGGLPDSILKPVMLSTLQRYLNRTEMHWLREHLEELIKQWKNEVISEVFYDRPTVVRMETVDYKPQVQEENRKRNKGAQKKAKAARVQMGVGAFLQQNRSKLMIDSGSVDFEEDQQGNVVLGGEMLSFESWAKITKTKGSGVVRASNDGKKVVGNGGMTRKQERMARIVQGMTDEQYAQWKKEQVDHRKSEKKIRIMKRGLGNGENEGNEQENGLESEKTAAEKKVQKELDEGEIDSEEEKKTEKQTRKGDKEPKKKRRKKRGGSGAAVAGSSSSSSSSESDSESSTDSSSSSSDDGGDGKVDSRQRRRNRRKKDRKHNRVTIKQPPIPPMVKAMFDNRKAIISQMSATHKLAFANVLNQIRQSNAPISNSQATQMVNAMFNGSGSGIR